MKSKSFFIKIIVILILAIFVFILWFSFTPYKKIVYEDNMNNTEIIININKDFDIKISYLYNATSLVWNNRLQSWLDVFLSRIMIIRENSWQPIVLKKCSIILYDVKGNIIPFNRIDWFNGEMLAEKNIRHFKNESELLMSYRKLSGDELYYIFSELNYKQLKIEYHVIVESNGQTYEIRDSKELHRNVKWKLWSIFNI